MKKKINISTALFILTIVLIAGFLTVWLRMVYKEKVAELDSKINFVWLSVLKEMDTDKFVGEIKMLFSKFEIADSNINADLEISIDSSKLKIERKIEEHQMTRMRLTSDSMPTAERGGFMITFDSDTERDSFFNISKDFKNKELRIMEEVKSFIGNINLNVDTLKYELNIALDSLHLPIKYEITAISDSFAQSAWIDKNRMYKHVSGKKYYLEVNSYGMLVWGKMCFEMAMAFLLLTLVAASFYYILSNLRKQNQLIQIKNDLISNITHELRTPIFTVSVALEALENFNAMSDPKRTKEYLDISKSELNRLSLLVDKVLKTSMFEEKIADLQLEEVNLVALIGNIQNSLKLLLEKFGAELVFDCKASELCLKADKIHLTNVIYNLIDNALKYNDKSPKIRLDLTSDDKNAILKVTDNGIGIEAKYIDKLFDRFFRVPTGNQHNVKGYGLGLNYVSGVVKKHGGSISVRSKAGEGTTFEIRLPVDK